RREHAALVHRGQHAADSRPRVHAALQPLSGGADHRAAGARLQLGAGHGGPRRGGEGGPAPGDRLRLGRPLVPGAQGGRPRGSGVRAVPRLRVPGPGRPLRELVAPVQRAPLRADRGGRGLPGPFPSWLRPGRLRSDRPRDAGRPRRQERDPDRGVREIRCREGPAPRGGGTGRRADPVAPDLDDVVRLHFRLRAAEARSLADVPWWDLFQDPVLKSLVDEALENGFDARRAAARVEEARALYGIARSEFLPTAGYQGAWERTRPDQFQNPSGETQTKWTANVGFGWGLDVWGRIRRLNEAAKAQYLATEEARRGVFLSLVSDVATAYFELRELDAELEIANRTTTAFQDTYDLFSRRLEGGAASALETARAEASLGQVAAQIPEIERAIVARESQINLLLGRNPQPVPREGPSTPLPPEIPAGLPSQLLE